MFAPTSFQLRQYPSRPGLRDRRSSGFSLIDLLVSLAIIALLMSITLPMLSQAREAARRLQCASHQRSMAIAINGYANDFSNRLPPSVFVSRYNRPQNLTTIRVGDDSQFRPFRGQNGYDGIGILYGAGYLQPPPSYYFCPSFLGDNTFDANRRNLTSASTEQFDLVTSNYIYRGRGPGGAILLTQFPSSLALISDTFHDSNLFNHDGGLNVLAAGGQVVWLADATQSIRRRAAETAAATANPEDADGLFTSSIWPLLDKGLDTHDSSGDAGSN